MAAVSQNFTKGRFALQSLMGTRDNHIIFSKKGLCLSKRQTWSVTARLHSANQPAAGLPACWMLCGTAYRV
jgi:hypothetical protein